MVERCLRVNNAQLADLTTGVHHRSRHNDRTDTDGCFFPDARSWVHCAYEGEPGTNINDLGGNVCANIVVPNGDDDPFQVVCGHQSWKICFNAKNAVTKCCLANLAGGINQPNNVVSSFLFNNVDDDFRMTRRPHNNDVVHLHVPNLVPKLREISPLHRAKSYTVPHRRAYVRRFY